jgi:hypothetical protein
MEKMLSVVFSASSLMLPSDVKRGAGNAELECHGGMQKKTSLWTLQTTCLNEKV